MKKIVGIDVLLLYPNFSEEYIFHIDARKMKLVVVMIQNGNILASYSHKLTPEQINFTTTEIELLIIVKNLKYFHTIILGDRITIYTYQKKHV